MFFIDSNVLLYAVDQDSVDKRVIAHDILVRGQHLGLILSSQILGEFLNFVKRKQPAMIQEASKLAEQWSLLYSVAWTSPEHILAGIRIADRYRLQFWDSVIIATAQEQRAETLLTEDMQDGFVINGLTLMNPFNAANRARLDELLDK